MTLQTDHLHHALPALPGSALPGAQAAVESPRAPRLPASWVPIRALAEKHRLPVLEHLLALSDADRQLRFGHLATDERVRSYAEQLDFDRDDLFGVFDRRLKLVALAHLALAVDDSGTAKASNHGDAGACAEFGVSVNAHARGRGLATQLFDHAVRQARNRGVGTMLIHMARDNLAMLAIARRAGATIVFAGSEGKAQLPLPAHTLGSQIGQLLQQRVADLDYRMKLQVLRVWSRRQSGLD